MPHKKVLTPEDDLFGRVALFNNLVTLEQIVECARIISAEAVAGRPRRSLASTLILKGHLAPQQAGAVEAAIRKRAGETGRTVPASTGPTPKPKPMQERAPSGHSQITVAVGAGEETSEAEPAPSSGAGLQRIIAKLVPGRIYPEMLDYIVRNQVTIVDVKKLAAAIEEPEKEVVAALKRWQKAGLLRKVGTHPYGFGPTGEMEQDIRAFLDAWHNPKLHSRILGHILACE